MARGGSHDTASAGIGDPSGCTGGGGFAAAVAGGSVSHSAPWARRRWVSAAWSLRSATRLLSATPPHPPPHCWRWVWGSSSGLNDGCGGHAGGEDSGRPCKAQRGVEKMPGDPTVGGASGKHTEGNGEMQRCPHRTTAVRLGFVFLIYPSRVISGSGYKITRHCPHCADFTP